jgi:hypothetical protein
LGAALKLRPLLLRMWVVCLPCYRRACCVRPDPRPLASPMRTHTSPSGRGDLGERRRLVASECMGLERAAGHGRVGQGCDGR